MKLTLVTIDPELEEAWKQAFAEFPEVRIVFGDILELAENTIVSPANSYGYMDGGLDRQYTDYFGYRPQQEIQEAITKRKEGYLPVGAAVLVNTGHHRIPYMIAAPTMMMPGAVPPANAFFAMAAMLNTAHRHSSIVTKVFCPGLATGIGQVPARKAAKEMADAYRKMKAKLL